MSGNHFGDQIILGKCLLEIINSKVHVGTGQKEALTKHTTRQRYSLFMPVVDLVYVAKHYFIFTLHVFWYAFSVYSGHVAL